MMHRWLVAGGALWRPLRCVRRWLVRWRLARRRRMIRWLLLLLRLLLLRLLGMEGWRRQLLLQWRQLVPILHLLDRAVALTGKPLAEDCSSSARWPHRGWRIERMCKWSEAWERCEQAE